MVSESLAYADIKWLHAQIKHHGLNKPKEGQGSAFAERVAIKLDGDTDSKKMQQARLEAFEEMFK